MKNKILFLLFLAFVFFPLGNLEAAKLVSVSDTISSHAANAVSDHSFKFTSPSGVHLVGDTIVLHMPASFGIGLVDFTDIDLSHGAITGFETIETLAAVAGVNVWGASFSGNNLILTAPSNTLANEIALNDIVRIEIGLNALGGNQQIVNAAVTGSYPVYIDGNFGDLGALALWVGNTVVGIIGTTDDLTDPTVIVNTPNGGEVLYFGDSYNLTWSASDAGGLIANPIRVYYSVNDGASWQLIISSLVNTGSYSWFLPDLNSNYIKIRVSAEDLFGNIGHDDSDSFFSIGRRSSGIATHPIYPSGESAGYVESQDRLPTIDGGWAYPGDLIKCPEYTTVYFYGFGQDRHFFPTESIFMTWQYDFSEVKIVALKDLVTLRLESNIKVRPGNILVKAVTHPDVFAVGANSDLYRIPSEAVAEELYGEDWRSKIIDIPVVFWGDYDFVGELNGDFYPDGTLIKYPYDVKTYLLKDQKKRWFNNEDAFYENHYYWKNIIEIPNAFIYEDAEDIIYREDNLIDPNYD